MKKIRRLHLNKYTVLYIPQGVGHPHYPAVKADKPLVEFYDKKYDHTPDGQFTGGRYYAKTLIDDADRLRNSGLCLHGGVPSWVVTATDMTITLNFIEKECVYEC